uniref:RagB/SusD family nutrient uptake outer membrane protein n=1 Tax=Pedobacter schmidteae TaxID=2201271 RepID=UPI000EB2BCF6|nr:RagB/SusD family nutrient uptake outer membrane protein [Pedobacter schmidteae]
MKRIKLITGLVFGMILLYSCKKYLTVYPKTSVPQEELFKSETGFKDAMTGVYIQMTDNNAYGGAMTQTTIESLISSWNVISNSTEHKLGQFDFSDAGVESALAAPFSQEYKIISSVNAILSHIDAQKAVFKTPGMYQTIKAECLAIRAYCHLDVLRLYGPVPTAPSNGNMLAYMTKLSLTPAVRIPFNEFRDAMLKDIAEAQELVKEADPIMNYSLEQLREPGPGKGFIPADIYLAYRYLKMNYYAIKALEARANLWFGNNTKAYECAKLVIDAKNTDGSAKFAFGTAADMAKKDFVLTREHIFGLYDFEMFTKYQNRYTSGTLYKGTSATTIKTSLYGNTGTDIRESTMWELITLPNASKTYIIKKYLAETSKTVTADNDFKQIPMLRVSEMFLIAAETAPFAEGLNYFKAFKTARGTGNQPLPADPATLRAEIIKEYRREFYAEGQAFFAYKRLNVAKSSMLFVPSSVTPSYLIPLPKTESIN